MNLERWTSKSHEALKEAQAIAGEFSDGDAVEAVVEGKGEPSRLAFRKARQAGKAAA